MKKSTTLSTTPTTTKITTKATTKATKATATKTTNASMELSTGNTLSRITSHRAWALLLCTIASVRLLVRIPLVRLALVRALLRMRFWARTPTSPMSRAYRALVGRLVTRLPNSTFALQEALPPLPVPSASALAAALAPRLRSFHHPQTPPSALTPLDPSPRSPSALTPLDPPPPRFDAALRTLLPADSAALVAHAQTRILTSRDALPLRANAYVLEHFASQVHHTHSSDHGDPFQTLLHRAAAALVALANILRAVHSHTLPPNRVDGDIPLCMWQYTRLFATVRQPGKDIDRLVQHSDSNHVVVCVRNRWYKLPLSLSIRPLRASLAALVQHATQSVAPSDPLHADLAAHQISALTALDRETWAQERKHLLESSEENMKSLYEIETALFALVLDVDNEPATVEEMAHQGMHHHGQPLWFDKSFNLIIFRNGRAVFNVEPSWGDVSIFTHITDYVFGAEKSFDYLKWESAEEVAAATPVGFQELTWKLDERTLGAIKGASASLQAEIDLFDIQVLMFNTFGKGFIKKASFSPDAFCQMAMQLAYYRLHKKFANSAETASTVRFQYGRSDLVRVLSDQAIKFVLGMCNERTLANERLELLRVAAKVHVRAIRLVTNGDGSELCLSYVRDQAKKQNVSLPQLDHESLAAPWVLYTAQIPSVDTLGAGFPPDCTDGYGITYTIAEDRLWFHVTSYKNQETSGTAFVKALRQALNDMKAICQSDPDLHFALIQRRYRVLNAE
eukprot:TRINITY_DN962_c0_g1_i1.p1 TRINITY_DN962_c0_g1~~TRINITY_DN962_c0_g1_i1.p1  ORF type:complete len:738 (+),score=126.11 TRINITY_DN962_c0_g1_i1:133-2346(+)